MNIQDEDDQAQYGVPLLLSDRNHRAKTQRSSGHKKRRLALSRGSRIGKAQSQIASTIENVDEIQSKDFNGHDQNTFIMHKVKRFVCESLEFEDEQLPLQVEKVQKALVGHQIKYEPFDMELNEEEKYLQEEFEIE